ncbi:MAG TPA: HepT-like ribonuclease domain-containing protein [Candidatus Limnocylindrales bacterium]|nr:HepT-like ribonuclease domain-containing protein [Candidatus Limnocylindrales bacterium]
MDLFEKQAQIQALFQTNPVDAAYAQGTSAGRKIAGSYADLDVALLLLDNIKTSEFFEYQVYFVSELSKALETTDLDVVILNQASLLQRAQVIRSWSVLWQRDLKRRVEFEARAVMEYLEFKKYDDLQSKALAERTRGERFAIDREYVRARLGRLREYVQLLLDLRPIEHQKFKGDPKLYGLAQWYLQQAVELLFGTGAYLVMALALPRPEQYHDILDAIANRGIVDKQLAYRLEHLANLRNLLAYDREQTDIDEVYGHIQTRLPDLVAFTDQIERFLGADAQA